MSKIKSVMQNRFTNLGNQLTKLSKSKEMYIYNAAHAESQNELDSLIADYQQVKGEINEVLAEISVVSEMMAEYDKWRLKEMDKKELKEDFE